MHVPCGRNFKNCPLLLRRNNVPAGCWLNALRSTDRRLSASPMVPVVLPRPRCCSAPDNADTASDTNLDTRLTAGHCTYFRAIEKICVCLLFMNNPWLMAWQRHLVFSTFQKAVCGKLLSWAKSIFEIIYTPSKKLLLF